MVLEELISSFRFGNNKARQLIEILNEISLRDGKPIDEPLRSPEWLEVYSNPKLHIYQKGLWLRKFLFSKRYPVYSELRDRIKHTLKKLKLPIDSDLLTLENLPLEYNTEIIKNSRFPQIEEATGTVRDADPVTNSKRNICYTTHKGNFLKKCPGTSNYLCCNYYVLNIQTNCNYDCRYCILQGYINNNRLNIYTNIDNALQEVEALLKATPANLYRIGTGELTDSLSLDYLTNTSSILIPFFIKQKNAMLELKTKSKNIKNLLRYEPNGNIVASWSLNPQKIIDEYEIGTASLTERLESSHACAGNGYRIGLHMDPVILYPEWEKDYYNLVTDIFKYVQPKDIAWISIAGFRYTPRLKNTILKRFPKTKLFLGEMIRCMDGKYRYIRPIRIDIYRKIINWLQQYDKNIPIYFCMESPAVWQDVFGKLPTEIPNLKHIFG